jgi:hypothetical protein
MVMTKVGEMDLRSGKKMEIYDDDSETESEEEFDDEGELCFYCDCEIDMTQEGGFLDAETGEVYCEQCYEFIDLNR